MPRNPPLAVMLTLCLVWSTDTGWLFAQEWPEAVSPVESLESQPSGHGGWLEDTSDSRFHPPPSPGGIVLGEPAQSIRASQLAAHRAGGVGIVAQVHRPQDGLSEVIGVMEGPESGFQASDDIARPDDVRRLLLPKTAGGYCCNLGVQGMQVLELT